MTGYSDNSKQKGDISQFAHESALLDEQSVYIEEVKVLQRQERVSYFFSLIISLVLVVLLFVILVIA